MTPVTPLILGHRGASALAPENTLAAFSRAIADGADGIEFDVRLSRDGVPVVIHDASLKRTGLRDQLVRDLTANELCAVNVGAWFTQRHPTAAQSSVNVTLPTLAQVFNEIAGSLYVELKCDDGEATALAAAVVEQINEAQIATRVVVESFDHSAVAYVKKLGERIRTAALFEPRLSRPLSTVRRLRMVDTALDMGADEIALHYTLAGPRVIEKAKIKGLETVVWTVDNVEWIDRAKSLGIKALIANNPGPMVRYRNLPATEC